MKRWLAISFISVYLGALTIGIGAHTINVGTGSHPAMYFVVWDMFCGWSSYASRMQMIAEGESGQYYEIAPGPWGEFCPYGNIGRRHYDVNAIHSPTFALNCLKHTDHEPIHRIIVFEEAWPKKYNIPDKMWDKWYDYPKDVKKYYHLRYAFTPEGQLLDTRPAFMPYHNSLAIASNPRLKRDIKRDRQFMAVPNLEPVPEYLHPGVRKNFFDKPQPRGPLAE